MRWSISSCCRDSLLIAVVALTLAALSARPYAGSWNDGSRLAAVESLVERRTLQIDESIFCTPPPETIARGQAPYAATDTNLLQNGTRDKLYINGHYYSDKPFSVSVLMAGTYQVGCWLGLPAPSQRPDIFCWCMTVFFSGGAYLISLLSLDRLCRACELPDRTRWLLVGSLGLSTVALTYTQHVNNHILLLAVVSLIVVQMQRLHASGTSWLRLAWLGTLTGIGFNLDLGSGPWLVLAVVLFVACQTRRAGPVVLVVLASAPWLIFWEALNYGIGGVWKPVNMVPEYLAWPGSPFDPSNMTGFVHQGPWAKFVYALALLFGKHGFFTHNLPLLLTLPAIGWAVRRSGSQRVLLACVFGWCVSCWLSYALLSNNYGGGGCSVRWFVPFLMPGYLLAVCYLRAHPERETDLRILSGWGAVLAVRMWWQGPFTLRMIAWLWPIVGLAILHWTVSHWREKRPRVDTPRFLPFGTPATQPLQRHSA